MNDNNEKISVPIFTPPRLEHANFKIRMNTNYPLNNTMHNNDVISETE